MWSLNSQPPDQEAQAPPTEPSGTPPPLTHWWEGRQVGQDKGLPSLPLSFYFLVFLVCDWLTQGSNVTRRRYDVLERHSAFFRHLMQVLVWEESATCHHCSLSSRYNEITRPHFAFWAGRSDAARRMGRPKHRVRTKPQGKGGHTSCVSAHTRAPSLPLTSRRKHSSKIQLVRISRWQQQSIKQSVGPFKLGSWVPDLDLRDPSTMTCFLFGLCLWPEAAYSAFLDLPWPSSAATCWLRFTRPLWVVLPGFQTVSRTPT